MTLQELLSKPVAEWTQADIDACCECQEKEVDSLVRTAMHAVEFAEGLKQGHAIAYRHVLEMVQIKMSWNK
jgi:hypothetical protein